MREALLPPCPSCARHCASNEGSLFKCAAFCTRLQTQGHSCKLTLTSFDCMQAALEQQHVDGARQAARKAYRGRAPLIAHRATACRELMKHLSKEASKLGKLRKKLQSVELWTRRRHVSLRLRRRIRSYYAEVWVRHNGARRAW